MLLPTSLVGSYPQPDWLIDRARLAKQVPRVRATDLWLVDRQRLEAAQDEATLIAIRDQERAGLDIVTDGEQRRESYSNRFATALEGIDIDNPGKTPNRTGGFSTVPRVVGPIRRKHPVEVRDVEFLRANSKRAIKMTVPGPFTMSAQCQDDFYRDSEKLALDYAAAVNAEIKDLFAAGADIVQIDEPWMQSRAELFLSRRVRELRGRPGLDRGGAAPPRPLGVAAAAIEDDHCGRDRPCGSNDRDAGNRGRAHPRGPALRARGAARGGARLRPQISCARGRVRKNARDGRGRRNRAAGIDAQQSRAACRRQPCLTSLKPT